MSGKEDEELVYRFVILAKGEKGKHVVEYMANEVKGIEIAESGVLEASDNGAKERTWGEELAELASLIEKSSDEFSSGNPIAVEGFNQIFSGGVDYLSRHGRQFNGLQDFTSSVLNVFKQSYQQYAAKTERPVRNTIQGRIYLRLGNHLTPREMRFIIKEKGLTGEAIPLEEIPKIEGLKARENTFGTRALVSRAHFKLLSMLLPPGPKYPFTGAGFNNRYTSQ